MYSNAEILGLFLWFAGLLIHFWKPPDDRHHFTWQGAGLAVWLALPVVFPHLRIWPYALGNAVFAGLFLFRLAQHRAGVRSS